MKISNLVIFLLLTRTIELFVTIIYFIKVKDNIDNKDKKIKKYKIINFVLSQGIIILLLSDINVILRILSFIYIAIDTICKEIFIPIGNIILDIEEYISNKVSKILYKIYKK